MGLLVFYERRSFCFGCLESVMNNWDEREREREKRGTVDERGKGREGIND